MDKHGYAQVHTDTYGYKYAVNTRIHTDMQNTHEYANGYARYAANTHGYANGYARIRTDTHMDTQIRTASTHGYARIRTSYTRYECVYWRIISSGASYEGAL